MTDVMVTGEGLAACLRVGDRAYLSDDTPVEVCAIAEAGPDRVAVVVYLRDRTCYHATGSYTCPAGTPDTAFASDLMPETHKESMTRMREHPETIGQWPPFAAA